VTGRPAETLFVACAVPSKDPFSTIKT
jgi:hypothetical protein